MMLTFGKQSSKLKTIRNGQQDGIVEVTAKDSPKTVSGGLPRYVL